jgi:hypothetical protein
MIINYSTGDTLTNAFYLSQSGSYFSLQNYYGLTANFSGGSITATGGYSSFIAGQPNILMVGVDGSGNSFIKLNNTTVVQGSGIHGGNTGTATLGVYYTGGLAALASKVLEVYCGTDVPSVANFNSLYTTINAKLTNTNNRGFANVLDNQTAQTAGEIVSFRSGGTELANIDWAGNIQANHFRSVNLTSNTMSVSGSTGFTSPSITGNDARGVITSTGGSSISVTAGTTVLTVTFANPYPNGTTPIAIIQPNNQNSIGLSGNFYATCTNTQMSIIAGSGFTTTAVSYILSYMVIG